MQLRIYYGLNAILLGIISAVVIAGVIIMKNFNTYDNKTLVLIIYFAVTILAYFIFKMAENNYDKRMIQKMVLKGDIALANIKSAKAVKHIKDTSGKHYHLWEVQVEYYDQQFKKHEYTLIDKFNVNLREIPNGTVYITHNENKPHQKFFVQNVMIGHVPSLQPIVAAYEKNKKLPIKYLNVYYNDGIIIETFETSMKNKAEAEKVKAEMEQKIDRQ